MSPTVKKILFGAVMTALAVSIWLAKHPYDIYREVPMPPLELESLEGEPFTLDQWPGPLVLNLFASWCSPCVAELPQLRALAEHLPVYGIAWQDDPQALKAWLEEHRPPFTAVGRDDGWELLWNLRIKGVPTTLVLDHDRRILYVHEGVIREEDVAKFMPAIFDVK